jgi:GNAT superfamily N-acetyltransferase
MSNEALSAIRRSSQAHCEQISQGVALTCGVAYYSTRFPQVPSVNQVRDVFLPDRASPQSVYDEVRAFYSEKGLRCGCWVPAFEHPVEPLGQLLSERGYRAVRMQVMLSVHSFEPASGPGAPTGGAIRILPARAVRAMYREIILSDLRYEPRLREAMADVAGERMDDPQYDMYVATLDGQPAGHGGLFQVGDIGRVEELFVVEAYRGKRVGSALLAYLVTMSRRLALRTTVLEVEAGSPAGRLCGRFGFEPAAEYVQWVAAREPGHA